MLFRVLTFLQESSHAPYVSLTLYGVSFRVLLASVDFHDNFFSLFPLTYLSIYSCLYFSVSFPILFIRLPIYPRSLSFAWFTFALFPRLPPPSLASCANVSKSMTLLLAPALLPPQLDSIEAGLLYFVFFISRYSRAISHTDATNPFTIFAADGTISCNRSELSPRNFLAYH